LDYSDLGDHNWGANFEFRNLISNFNMKQLFFTGRMAQISRVVVSMVYCFIVLMLVVQPVLAQNGVFGSIQNPLVTVGGDKSWGDLTGVGGTGGLVGFISAVVKTVTVVAGIYTMFNFIIAGLDYITSQGDPKGTESAQNKIKQSIIGLVIIAGTFAITAMASRVLFGTYDAILRPTIYGPGSTATTSTN